MKVEFNHDEIHHVPVEVLKATMVDIKELERKLAAHIQVRN